MMIFIICWISKMSVDNPYPLAMTKSVLLTRALEIVNVPIDSMGIFQFVKRLPEANLIRSH